MPIYLRLGIHIIRVYVFKVRNPKGKKPRRVVLSRETIPKRFRAPFLATGMHLGYIDRTVAMGSMRYRRTLPQP